MYKKNDYFIGISWFILSILTTIINNVTTQYIVNILNIFQIIFLRSLSSSAILIPIILINGKSVIKTSNIFIHFARGGILFLSITAWSYGLKFVFIATASVISFSIPLFTLILSTFFLKENIIWQRWVVIVLGFIGIVVAITPHDFNLYIITFILSAAGFAILDIINKKFIIQETTIGMLFYSAAFSTMISAPLAIYYWVPITLKQLIIISSLGIEENLISLFILKALLLLDVTALAPYRYLEFIFTSIICYILHISGNLVATCYGSIIILSAIVFLHYSEKKQLAK